MNFIGLVSFHKIENDAADLKFFALRYYHRNLHSAESSRLPINPRRVCSLRSTDARVLFASRRISKVSTKSRVSNRRHRRRTFAASFCLDLSAEREVSALLRSQVSVLSSVSVLSAVEEEQAPPLSSSFSFSFSLLRLVGSPESEVPPNFSFLCIAPVKLLRRDPRLSSSPPPSPILLDAFILFRKREREREQGRGGSASFEANERIRENNRRDNREIFEFRSKAKKRDSSPDHSFFSFWESDLTFFESPLHNPTTTTAAAHVRAF